MDSNLNKDDDNLSKNSKTEKYTFNYLVVLSKTKIQSL